MSEWVEGSNVFLFVPSVADEYSLFIMNIVHGMDLVFFIMPTCIRFLATQMKDAKDTSRCE